MSETEQGAALESAEETKRAVLRSLEELLGIVRETNAVTVSKLVLATLEGSTQTAFLRFVFALLEDVAKVEPLSPHQQAQLLLFRAYVSVTNPESK